MPHECYAIDNLGGQVDAPWGAVVLILIAMMEGEH